MADVDNKVVSIEFDNNQFEKDVSKTMQTIDALDEATSGKKLKGDGISGLESAFNNLGKTATDDIDQINSKLADTSSYSKMSESINGVHQEFNTLQVIGIGALLAIGETAIQVGSKIASTLTAGIRDGWSEYNLIMDSTQTILANTQRYGTDLGDVTSALDVLNEYADKTIYNFSQMTRNIGLFTTAGMNLEDSVTAIKGMSNLGAVFGADNAAMARATYQMSQAMSSGFIKLRDWMSMENAGMGGKLLQEELIETAAIMSGQSVDAFKDYIGYSKGFRNTLESNWLTADVYLETMRKFAGESREYWESLKAADGSRLYTDEQIDELMQTAASAEEAATKVRTFRMMIEALMESIGSGWSTTFRLLIGDLEQAKEFWTPINDLLSGIINRVGDYRNSIIKSWADIYRNIAIEDMMTALRAIGDIFGAIGRGISRAFGSTHSIAGNIGKVTEAIGDLATTMTLTDEELESLSRFVEGLLSPLTIFGDLIYEIARTFFNASDAMNEFDTRGDSLVDKMQGIRKMFFNVLEVIGAFGKKVTDVIRNTGVVSKAVEIFAKVVKGLYDVVYSFLTWVGPILENLFVNYLLPFLGLFAELGITAGQWIRNLWGELQSLDINLLQDFRDIFEGIKDIFIALIDPTINVSDAIANFKNILSNTSIATIIDTIRNSLDGLWNSLKNTRLFQFFISAIEQFKQTDVGIWLFDIIERLKGIVGTIFGSFSNLGNGGGFLGVIQSIIDYLIPLKDKIAGLGLVDSAIVILKSIFETIGSLITSVIHGLGSNISGIDFESNVETIANRIIKVVEILMILGTILAVSNLPKFFAKTAHNIIFQIFDPISDMFLVVKERFKRDTWQVIGDFFKNLAIFVAVMAGSILVLASLKDPYIALPLLVTMFAGIAIVMNIMMTSIESLYSSIKATGLSGVGQMFAVVMALSQISTIVGEIMGLIAIIAVLAYLFSSVDSEQRTAIAVAFAAMVMTFTLISSMIMILMDKMATNFTVLAALDSSLAPAVAAYNKIINSIAKLMIVIGLMAAILMKASGGDTVLLLSSSLSLIAAITVMVLLASHILEVAKGLMFVKPEQIEAVTSILGSLATVFLVISASITLLSALGGDATNILVSALSILVVFGLFTAIATAVFKFANETALVNEKTIGQLTGFMAALAAITLILAYTLKLMLTESPDKLMEGAITLIFIIGVFSLLAFKLAESTNQLAAIQFKNILKLAATMGLMIAALYPILGAMFILDKMITTSSLDTVGQSLLILAAILAGMLVLLAVLSDMQKSGLINAKSMIGIAASMLILSLALIPISASISLIAGISSDGNAAIKAAASLAIVLGTIALSVGLIATVWSKLQVDMLSIIAATAAFVIIANSLKTIALAIIMVAAIGDVSSALNAILEIMLAITVIMGLFTIIGVASQGIGAAVLLAVAVGFYVMAKSVLELGKAALAAGVGVKTFSEGMAALEQLDPDKLLASFKAVAMFFPIMAAAIVNNGKTIKKAVGVVFDAIGAGIFGAIKLHFVAIGSVIVNGLAEIVRVALGLLVELFDVLMTTLHSLLVILNDFLKKEIGPGGVLRELAVTLADFILWLAGFLAGYALTVITTIADALADAISNDGIITRLVNAIERLFLSIKIAFYNWIGYASLGEWAVSMALGLVGSIVDVIMAGGQWIVDALNDIAEEITGERIDTLDSVYNSMGAARESTMLGIGGMVNTYMDGQISDAESRLAQLETEADALDERLSAEQERQRAIAAEGDTSVYNPSRYYAAQAGVDNYNSSLSRTPSLIESITSALGGSGGLSDIINSIFGGSSGGGWSLSNIFGSSGEASAAGSSTGSSWAGGFSSAVNPSALGLDSLSNTSFENLNDISNVDWSGFNAGLENANMEMDDMSSPVITPVIDDTQYNLGLDRMEGAWNSHRFDQLAIDTGVSMLAREQADGDATTDGNVVYNFTQNNYSPESISDIDVYRYGRNAFGMVLN